MYAKYKAKKTVVDGIVFHSGKEAKRYQELKILLVYKKIYDLKLQPRFPLVVEGEKICTYVADFMYNEDGQIVIEDVKGVRTREYIIKKKLFEVLYSMKIRET